MSFSDRAKLTALAIVHIFETSKPFGDYAACVVLNDGAGVSYGINQFTHRSGSLLAVVNEYLEKGGAIGREVIEENLHLLRIKTVKAIRTLSINERFKKALKAAAISAEMKEAQREIAEKLYLSPAIEACEGSGFGLPLSLGVIYDSINHGSWERIRDKVRVSVQSYAFRRDEIENIASKDTTLNAYEKAWITEYVRKRDAWLESVPRLKATTYRTDFFLAQIARNNWNLDLPLNVHGLKLTKTLFERDAFTAGVEVRSPDSAVEPDEKSAKHPPADLHIPQDTSENPPTAKAQPSNDEAADCLDKIQEKVDRAASKYDQVEDIVTTVITRKDAAKSLWTTVISTIWQSAWAVAALITGIPREVWLTVAVIAAAFMLVYLYRQIALGKIRERSELRHSREDHP